MTSEKPLEREGWEEEEEEGEDEQLKRNKVITSSTMFEDILTGRWW
jgi:hypothetical protein